MPRRQPVALLELGDVDAQIHEFASYALEWNQTMVGRYTVELQTLVKRGYPYYHGEYQGREHGREPIGVWRRWPLMRVHVYPCS